MKHSYLKITCISISLSFAFLFVSVASGQTSSSGLIWVYTNAPDITSRSPVLVLDRTTRTEIKRFYPGANWSGLGPCMYGRGIAYDPRDGNLWVAMNRGACGPDGGTQGDGLIHKINSWDGSDLGSIPDPTKPPTAAAVSLGAMDYDAQENVLYGVSSEGVCYEDNKPCYYRLFKLNADTGSVIWRVELNDPAIFHPHTLAVKRDQTGRKVLSLNYGYVSTENGQILTAFNSSTGLIGLDIDEATGEEISAGGTRDDISIQVGRSILPEPIRTGACWFRSLITMAWCFEISSWGSAIWPRRLACLTTIWRRPHCPNNAENSNRPGPMPLCEA